MYARFLSFPFTLFPIFGPGLGLALSLGASLGCGYTLQGVKSRDLEKLGVERVYVIPFQNNTYKVGTENLIYNALVRIFSAFKRLHLVQNLEDAEATIHGTVITADYSPKPATMGGDKMPPGVFSSLSGIAVTREYNAHLSCQFSLTLRKSLPGKTNTTVWSGSFSRTQAFVASQQLGALGTTSPLITESEFERALAELAILVTTDAHESLTSRF